MATRATRKRLDPTRVLNRCTSQKSSYDTYSEALTAAEQMMAMGKVNVGCHLTPYLCHRCDLWHVYNREIQFPQRHSSTW